jgi:hypothetical protein
MMIVISKRVREVRDLKAPFFWDSVNRLESRQNISLSLCVFITCRRCSQIVHIQYKLIAYIPCSLVTFLFLSLAISLSLIHDPSQKHSTRATHTGFNFHISLSLVLQDFLYY